MKYISIGILLGLIINFLPVFSYPTGMRIFPEWKSSLSSIQETRTSPFMKSGNSDFIIDTRNSFYTVGTDGSLKNSRNFDEETLHNISGNGKYYVTYKKIGDEISFYNQNNEIFWKHATPQYPYLSYNAKFALLLIADLSGVKIIDSDSNATGAGEISGKLLNSITFTEGTDFAALGFMNGKYYALDLNGDIFFSGDCGNDFSVKTTGLSTNGKFMIIHFGSSKKDGIIINDIERNKKTILDLAGRHLTKTAVCINDKGYFSAIDSDRIIISKYGTKKVLSFEIPQKMPGECGIFFRNGLFFAVFRTEKGSAAYAYDTSGNIVFSRIFREEPFLQQKFSGNSLILRGTDNLYCYTFQN